MYKASELNDLGKQLATSYLQDGKNLTDHLQKVATDRGLTKQQVDRVAEVANVETYLNLMKTAENSYIEFDVADPLNIKVEKNVEKSATVVDDYERAPEYEFSLESYFGSDLQEPEREDTAAMRKHAQELKGKIEYLNNRLAEAASTYE